MPEISKEYQLLKKDIDFDYIQKSLIKIESNNDDLVVEIFEKIPDEIIEDHVEFNIEAEKNTLGLLRSGEESRISIESIKTQYNLRSDDKFYFDVLVIDQKTNKIIGKLNSWGYKKGGPFFIFHMYVSEKYRNRGLGTLLLFKTVKIATDNISHLTRFDLQTHESNASTQKIISRIGFKQV